MGSHLVTNDDYISCGPEQILARIPAISMNQKWRDNEREMSSVQAKFNPDEEIMMT